ncbi:hypothetical protein M9435_001932 [Picochlorum sp. BPE23]|nr:hypothetical protein M9435_001932 [Picochlorum sp. BPE23]
MQGDIEADGVIRNPPSHRHAGNPDTSEESNKYRLRGKRVKYTDFDDVSDDSEEEEKDALKLPEDGNPHDSDAYYSAGEDLMDNGLVAMQGKGTTLSPRSHRRELRRHSNRECARRIRQRREETIQELESKREQLMKQNEHLLEIACTTLITWQRIVQETSQQQQQAISMKKRTT